MFAGATNTPHRELSALGLAVQRGFIVFALATLLTSLAAAQTLTGTVKNATTGKPAAGDDVVLLSLTQGMEESARTKTDAKGHFTLKLDDAQSPHLVRAIHEGVTYHRMAPPGTTSVELEVFDAGKKIDGITVVADIMKIQAEKGQLEIVRAFAVQNSSKPPRTQMSERNMEFYVPEGAQIIGGQAVTEHGNPLNSAPVPVDDKKTRYSFIFPLRPGTTQFQVAYQLPYSGSANIDPKSVYPLQHFVAIVPKSMEFSGAPGTPYQSMNNPNQPDSTTEVASGTKVGQPLAFKVSGEGTLADQQESRGQGGAQAGGEQVESAPPSTANRPGGGLGPPIDAPDPLQKYRWPILGGFAAVLLAGAMFVGWRQQSPARSAGQRRRQLAVDDSESDYDLPEAAALHREPSPATRKGSSSMLLEALKEEIFQLEVEHKQGHISQQEYEQTKAALDKTLQHALKREAQKT
ncbi:MAG TPA: carboxypeptidase regulatory-like domain-containing protein [Candidatus Sulfotelmatobacter sp.]